MKWIDPIECGLSKWAEIKRLENGAVSLERLSDYWLSRLPAMLNGPAGLTSGLKFDFTTDSAEIKFKYTCRRFVKNACKICFTSDNKISEYELIISENEEEISFKPGGSGLKKIEIALPWNGTMEISGVGIEDDAVLSPSMSKGKTICFYGDSITHGIFATSTLKTYPYIASKILDMNYINHGYGGSAFPDPAMAIYLSTEVMWDYLVVAIGTNSYGTGYEPADAFKLLYSTSLEILCMNNKNKPVFCVTPIWMAKSDRDNNLNKRGNCLEDYRIAIREAVTEIQEKYKQVYLIEGNSIISGPEGISEDLVHPDDTGMEMIGSTLANYILEKIK